MASCLSDLISNIFLKCIFASLLKVTPLGPALLSSTTLPFYSLVSIKPPVLFLTVLPKVPTYHPLCQQLLLSTLRTQPRSVLSRNVPKLLHQARAQNTVLMAFPAISTREIVIQACLSLFVCDREFYSSGPSLSVLQSSTY